MAIPIYTVLPYCVIVWGMSKDLTTLEIRSKLADLGLASFVRGNVLW